MVLTSHDTLDPVSDAPDAHTDDTRRFRSDEAPQRQLATTLKLSDVKAGDFDAIFYPGGHGPLWDLAEDAHNRRLIAFRHAQGADGRKLVAGKRVTERGLVQLGRPRRHPRHGPDRPRRGPPPRSG